MTSSTYTNPVLHADWPDPDVVRFGDEFVMVASSFNKAPGLPVLRSTDLVAWTLVGHALPALPPEDHFRLPRLGGGVWAPAIREHAGRLVIVWPDPDHGIWTTWAADPAGPWSAPHLLLEGVGLIDPCPLWDDDGSTYLVHAWAGSRAGIKNRLTVVPVDDGLTRAVGPPRTVVDGNELPGYTTLEGPKLYKRDGWYWIFAPAGGVATGWQSVFRSRSVWGPYDARIVLEQGGTTVNGPHQGAWVTDVEGADWFVHFQERQPFGRIVHVQPMSWGDDGWPRMGRQLGEGRGEPVEEWRRPASAAPHVPAVAPAPASDDFTSAELGPHWCWQANPRPDWHATGAGRLELRHLPNDRGDLRTLPQVLAQQLPGSPVRLRVRLELRSGVQGARLGLVVLGRQYGWVGLARTPAGVEVVAAHGADPACERTVTAVPIDSPCIDVELDSRGAGAVLFRWKPADADRWSEPILQQAASEGHWIGAQLGLFATMPLGHAEPEWSRVHHVVVTHG